MYQYNKSAILIEVSGKRSAGKRIRAPNVCYFFMTYQFEKENLQIKFCPIDGMWGDFMAKPTQGAKFMNFIHFRQVRSF